MKYSASFKLWHWLNAFVVLGLLGTVFLRKTFLSWRTNSEILMSKLSEFGVDITAEQAKILAKAIRSGMWEWHLILGYVLMFLVVYRIYLHFTDSKKEESFSSLDLHKKVVKISYYIFYLVLFVIAISGMMLAFRDDLGLSKELSHNIKEIHEIVYYYILYFAAAHIAGVVIAELRDEKGLISSMIGGDKK